MPPRASVLSAVVRGRNVSRVADIGVRSHGSWGLRALSPAVPPSCGPLNALCRHPLNQPGVWSLRFELSPIDRRNVEPLILDGEGPSRYEPLAKGAKPAASGSRTQRWGAQAAVLQVVGAVPERR